MSNSEIKSLYEEIEHINFHYILKHRLEHPLNCIYCDAELSPEKITRDHIVPKLRIFKKGSPSFRMYFGTLNTVGCCRNCNQSKGSSSLMEWAETVRKENRMDIWYNLNKMIV